MKKTPFMVRHGDVLVIRQSAAAVAKMEVEAMPVDVRGIVLAEGETSGHHHAVIGRGGEVKLMRFRDGRSDRLLEIGTGGADVRVIGGGSGGVDRHTPISLEKGTYIVRVQRSWSSAARSRQVQD